MSHATAKLLLAAALALFFGPLLLGGKVLLAHDNAPFVGLRSPPDGPVSNGKFADQSFVYLPQIAHQVDGESDGWIATWDPHTELGRPAWHSSGLSKSFFVFHALTWLTRDPLLLYTLLAVLATCAAAAFGYLFLQELALLPAACLLGALGLSLGVFPAYWLSFVMFLWGIAWTLGCLWLVTRLVRRPTLPDALGLVACIHGQLLSGYPQETVWHAYVVVGYACVRLVRDVPGWRARLARALPLAACALVAVVSVLPTFLELGLALRRSGRAETDPSFFLGVLPRIGGLADLGLFATLLHDATWLGNPIVPDPAFPRFNGVSLGPVLAGALLLVAATGTWRRVWPALLLVAAAALATLVPAAYAFGVRHLGLGVSRYIPLAGVWVPLVVLGAHAADAHLRALAPARVAGAALVLAGPFLAGAGAALGTGPAGAGLDLPRLLLSLALSAGVALFAAFPRAWLLCALAVASTLLTAFSLRLARPAGDFRVDSPLVELVRRETPGGARFAWVLPPRPGFPADPGLLPPNEEDLLGLSSIHAYDSLSSRAYQEWVLRLGSQGTYEAGRYFKAITSTGELSPDELALAGIGLVLTPLALDRASFEELPSPITGLRVQRPRRSPLLFAQVDSAGPGAPDARVLLDEGRRLPVERTVARHDHQVYRTTPSEHETWLFVSQQHHPHWSARAGGETLETRPLLGFYEGVRLPPGTDEVELRYLSPVRFSHLPQLGLILAALALGIARFRAGRRP